MIVGPKEWTARDVAVLVQWDLRADASTDRIAVSVAIGAEADEQVTVGERLSIAGLEISDRKSLSCHSRYPLTFLDVVTYVGCDN